MNKPSILFVHTGSMKEGEVQTSTFVKSQAQSLEGLYNIDWFLLKNNTSISEISKAIKALKEKTHESSKIDLLHAHYGSVTALITVLGKRNIPVVVSYGGDDLLGTIQKGWKWRIRERLAIWMSLIAAYRSDAIIVKSKNLLEALPSALRKKTAIIPNGVNTALFQPIDQWEARQKTGLDPQKKYVLFNASTGNNQPVKNRPLAEQVIARAKEKEPNIELLAVERVPQQELVLLMNAADALILTSIHEGSPNIVKEAMACDLPVVSVNCGDVKERLALVNKGGYFSYDPIELADALLKTLNNTKNYNGRSEIFRQGLDNEATVDKIKGVYEFVLHSESYHSQYS